MVLNLHTEIHAHSGLGALFDPNELSVLIYNERNTQNQSSSESPPKLLIQSRFCTRIKYDETKDV